MDLMINVTLNALVVIALVSLLRSTIVERLVVHNLRAALLDHGLYLLVEGLDCNECCAFWLTLLPCIPTPGLILPTYGVVIWILWMTKLTTTSTSTE